MALIPAGRQEDRDEALRSRLIELEAALDERTAFLAELRTSLEGFRIRYRHEVGQLHEQLDELLDAIEEAELDVAAETDDADDGPAGIGRDGAHTPEAESPASPVREPAPRYTSDAVRKLFRDVAKTIHPDLSSDADARDRRHALMIEANRAYALGDLDQLRRILDLWHGSPEAVQGNGPEAARERLVRRVAELEAQLAACDEETKAMDASALGRLKAMVDEASANGKDLVADMIRRLERDIVAARNRLEAIRWRP